MSRPTVGRVALNVLSTWGGQAISLALAFVFTPFIVRSLGDAAYGVWLLTVSITGFLALLDLGVRGAVTRYVARFAAVDDHESASRTASSALRIFGITTIVVTALSAAIALFALDRFDIPADYQGSARIVLVLAGLNLGASLIGGTYAGAVAARNRIDLLNYVDVAAGVLRTLATVAALAAGYGLLTMAAIHLLLSVLRVICVAAMLKHTYQPLRIEWGLGDAEHVRLILSFSLFSFLIHLSGRFIYYADALVIGALLPVALVTTFGIGANLIEYARTLISSVSYATSPVASSLEGSGDQGRLQRLVLETAAFSMMILLPIAVTFLIRGRSFIGLWMGPDYAAASGEVLAILALPLMFHAAAHGLGGIMLAIGRHKPMIPAMLLEAAANVALSVALIPSLGISGVAWGTAIPSVIASVVFWPPYVTRATGVSLPRFLMAAWLRPAVAVVPFILATVVVERFWPAASLAGFFVQTALCSILAAGGGWALCLTPETRARLLGAVRSAIDAAPRALSVHRPSRSHD